MSENDQVEECQKKACLASPPPTAEETREKMELFTLGVGNFVIPEEEEEADCTDSRIGDINPDGTGIGGEKLERLWLRKNLISEIQGLHKLVNLKELELYDNKIVQIKGLDNMPNLEILDLSYNNIKKIENLDKLPNLRKLFLLSNKIKKMLELGSNKIREIENLENLPNLTSLFLGKNRITEIKNLGHFKKLKQIALGPNRITKIENLEELKDTLEELYLQENQIQKIENIGSLTKLTVLDISYNKVEHLEGIENLSELDALCDFIEISLFGNDVVKSPDYKMKLIEMLPLIDDIDGTPMKTTYRIVYGSQETVQSSKKEGEKLECSNTQSEKEGKI